MRKRAVATAPLGCAGMPPNAVAAPEMTRLLKFLRTIERQAPPVVRMKQQTTDGRTLDGQVRAKASTTSSS